MIDRSRSPVPRQQQIQNIQIVLQTLAGGHTPTVTLDARATLSALRMKIAAAIHQEGGVKQTLVFRESVLPEAKDHASLADLGICDGATLTVVKESVRKVLTASADWTAKIWNSVSGNCLATLAGHASEVKSAVFSSDNALVVTASRDCTAKIWCTASGECLLTLKGHKGWVNSAVFSSNDASVVTASNDLTVKMWNIATGECVSTLTGHTDWVISAVFSSQNTLVVTASHDNTAIIWDVAARNGKQSKLTGHRKAIKSAVFSSNNAWVVTASADATAKTWNSATGECIVTLTGHTHAVTSAIFSSDDNLVVTASYDRTAKIWDFANEGECLFTLEGHRSCVNSAIFSPDNASVVTASNDGTSKIWNSASGKCSSTLVGANLECCSTQIAIFSSDGTSVLTALGRMVQLWSAASGDSQLCMCHEWAVCSACFSC